MATKLPNKSMLSRYEPEKDYLTAMEYQKTQTRESVLMPHHLYYVGPHEANRKLDLRFLSLAPIGIYFSSQNITNVNKKQINFLPEFEPKTANGSSSKIQVTELKPNFKSNEASAKILKHTLSTPMPTFLKEQEKSAYLEEAPQQPIFRVFVAPQQKKIVSNLIKVNQNNYFQTPSPLFNNSGKKKIISNEHDSATIVYKTINLQNLNINKSNELSFQNSKENLYNDKKKLPKLKVPQENEIRFMVNVPPLPIKSHLGNFLPKTKNNDENSNASNEPKNPQLDVFLSILQETKKLPKNFTSGNLSNGIKTLAFILQRLQEEKKSEESRSKQTSFAKIIPTITPDKLSPDLENYKKTEAFPQLSEASTPGKPGTDYPIYASIPNTKFDCSTQRYKGFFADPDTNCQVWHYCDLNGGQASFLCPNGTIFSQAALTCDWWFNVKCASTSQLYVLNERLYKYILPFAPSFPEDYSGPLVDRYLRAKFKEKEIN